MPTTSENNKRIAKNTLLLYMRMIFLMLISLYTSRVVLSTLGVNDYGTYHAVGGVVLLLQFLNAALSNGTSRYITFELGKGEKGETNKVFQTAFITHIALALIIIIIAETIGLWFVTHKLVIPPERMSAALFTFHCSVLASAIAITQVPYNALLISHERMNIYAYISIVEGVLKLLIVYLLLIISFDRLIVYAILVLIVQFTIAMTYRIYCIKSYKESTLHGLKFSKSLTKEMLVFSSWSLIGNAAHALNGQGMTIITNLFFGPQVVAARALSIRINTAVMGLVQNFRTAANPRIIKLYSGGDKNASQRLELDSTRYAFLLMLLAVAPVFTICDNLLHIWLVEVPPYTTIFVQLILLQSLFFTIDTSLYTALYACGKVKVNALISPMLYLLQFIVVYILFKLGFSPVVLSVAGVITSFVAGFLVKPVLLKHLAEYRYEDIYKSIGKALIAALIVSPLMAYWGMHPMIELSAAIIKCLIVFFITTLCVYYVGLKRNERTKLRSFIYNKINSIIRHKNNNILWK